MWIIKREWTFANDSFTNLPDEVVPAIRQREVNIIGIYEYYIYILLEFSRNYYLYMRGYTKIFYIPNNYE